MSTSITNAFVKQYEGDVHHVFQREGSSLKPSVRVKSGIVGASTTFQKLGTGTATTKARHGVITPMNAAHTAVECALSDYYAGDWVDRLDEAKVSIDERQALARSGAYALGRKSDELIIAQLDATGQGAIAWNEASAAGVRNALLQMVEALDDNDVPNDGGRYGLLTPRAWAMAMTVREFSSADFLGADGLPFREGAPVGQRWKAWMGVMWKQHTGLPGKGTAAAKVFAYHRNAVGFAIARESRNVAGNEAVSADITWHGDRAAHFVNHCFSAGACLIDDTGVIEGQVDDTAAIPTG